MKVFILLVLLLNLQLVWNDKYTRTALKFGEDGGSYIYMGFVDFTAMEEDLTVCSWVRRMSSHFSIYQCWLSYVGTTHGTEEILISDAAFSNLLNYDINYPTDTQTLGSWNHMCVTFSYSKRTVRSFYNGELFGQKNTRTGRKLDRTGSLMLGNYHLSGGRAAPGNYFGGELYDTNFLSVELSADQINDLYKAGRCSDYSDRFADDTVLSWEDIVALQRAATGNVTYVEFECDNDDPTEETTEETTEEATEEVTEESTEDSTEESTEKGTEDSGGWEFLRSKEFYNLLITEEMVSQLELLEEFLGHRIDDNLIQHLVKHHSDTV